MSFRRLDRNARRKLLKAKEELREAENKVQICETDLIYRLLSGAKVERGQCDLKVVGDLYNETLVSRKLLILNNN